MVFSGVVNGFGLLEGGWFCLSAVVWGWGWGGGVGGASLPEGVFGAVLLRGAGCDVSACWKKGMGPISGNQKNQSLVKSKPVEAFEK